MSTSANAAAIAPAARARVDNQRNGFTVRAGRGLMRCAHCHSQAIISDSKADSDTIKELYFTCPNVDCGHTWKAQLSVVYTIRPSGMPRDGVDLPMCPPRYIRSAGAPDPGNDPGPPLPLPATA